MRKLTSNQENTMSCLTSDYSQLKDICDRYAVLMTDKGYSPNGYVWKNEVARCLNALIKKKLVIYRDRGMYALATIKKEGSDSLEDKLQNMKSGVIDKNGTEVKVGDSLVIPYVDPMGKLTEEEDYRVTVEFKHGCYGYHNGLRFVPLFEWQKTKSGDYVSNRGNSVIYLEEYPFWVAEKYVK